MISRRGLITGLVSLVAAPAVVRAASLMPVKAIKPYWLTLYCHGVPIEFDRAVDPAMVRLLEHRMDDAYRAMAKAFAQELYRDNQYSSGLRALLA